MARVMDELELRVQYPLGTKITFMNPPGTGHATGHVNDAPIVTDDDQGYVPVWFEQRKTTLYVNTNNIVEEEDANTR